MGISIVWDDVCALAPEFANVAVSGQDQIIAQVLLEVNPAAWGSDAKATTAALWLARHLASIYGKGGTGHLSSVSVGSVSKSFAQLQDWKSLLATTRYGQNYLRCIRLWLPRMILT
jgi:hypothetical protein